MKRGTVIVSRSMASGRWFRTQVKRTATNKRSPAHDLTFSVPKSVSTYLSQAPTDIREIGQSDHNRAVRFAMSCAEELIGASRRGKGGKVWEKADLIAAIFEHGTSRAEEPQIHSHVIVLAIGVRSDRSTGALVTKGFYDYQMAARAARVNDAFGNPLMIEVRDLVAQNEIFEQRRPVRISFERVLVIRKRDTLIRGERRVRSTGGLVQFATVAGLGSRSGHGTFSPGLFSRTTSRVVFAHLWLALTFFGVW